MKDQPFTIYWPVPVTDEASAQALSDYVELMVKLMMKQRQHYEVIEVMNPFKKAD